MTENSASRGGNVVTTNGTVYDDKTLIKIQEAEIQKLLGIIEQMRKEHPPVYRELLEKRDFVAPESERAQDNYTNDLDSLEIEMNDYAAPEPTLTCSDCGHPKDDSRFHLDAPGTNWGAALHAFVPPTPLTCSEVVERLAAWFDSLESGARSTFKATLDEYSEGRADAYKAATHLIRKEAEALLHSWRERRVQELEEALRITSASIAKEMNRFDYEELDGSGAIITAEEVYKQSLEKAREQIRKGAKHE